MAEKALVSSYTGIQSTGNAGELSLEFTLHCMDENNPNSAAAHFNDAVVLLWSDTPAQMKTKIMNRVVAIANANSYAQLTSADVFLPNYTKG
jgi:hypothetical protein